MKYPVLILLAMLALFGTAACSDNGEDSPALPAETIILRDCSIKEGAEVDAANTTMLTLTYNKTVKLSPSAVIKLNDDRLSAATSATTSMMLEIPLSLTPGTDYTLSIPSGSVIGKTEENTTAKDFTLHFKTAKQAVVDLGDIADLCDPQATAEAKTLYDLLRQNYGSKMFSSVIAEVNWNTQVADKIASWTGKHPAFNCYDFIHIYVPEGNNWIDYNDLKAVTDWTDKGGLVQLMWHFNVPLSETTVVKTDGSGVTCTPSQTTFKASNALKDGTWENSWFYGQMDKVASVLLALQEKHIAALWRPFHEAAGNATAKQQADWTKSWFWWGFDGADTCKKLWTAMYDYFQQKGIHNLIWVWTTQNYNGNSAQYNVDSDWYPGDKYVDIIGRDLYAYTASQNRQEFSEIASRYPKKMIALAECGNGSEGNFDKMSNVWREGAHWAWFMPWYGSNLPDATWWKDAMSDDNIITLEDLKK